jgi:hypothetical protein
MLGHDEAEHQQNFVKAGGLYAKKPPFVAVCHPVLLDVSHFSYDVP